MPKLFTSNREENNTNQARLNEIGEKVVLAQVKNTGSARSINSILFRGFMLVYLSVSCKATLTMNVLTAVGLNNCSVDIIKEFNFDEGKEAPALPNCVWINIEGCSGWVPIIPDTGHGKRRVQKQQTFHASIGTCLFLDYLEGTRSNKVEYLLTLERTRRNMA